MQPTSRGVHYGISAFSVSLLMNWEIFPSADEAETGCLFHFFFFSWKSLHQSCREQGSCWNTGLTFYPVPGSSSVLHAGRVRCVCVCVCVCVCGMQYPASRIRAEMFLFVLLPQRSMNMHEKMSFFTEVWWRIATFEKYICFSHINIHICIKQNKINYATFKLWIFF